MADYRISRADSCGLNTALTSAQAREWTSLVREIQTRETRNIGMDRELAAKRRVKLAALCTEIGATFPL